METPDIGCGVSITFFIACLFPGIRDKFAPDIRPFAFIQGDRAWLALASSNRYRHENDKKLNLWTPRCVRIGCARRQHRARPADVDIFYPSTSSDMYTPYVSQRMVDIVRAHVHKKIPS